MRTLQGLAANLLDDLAKAEDLTLRDTETGGREGAIAAITAVCDFVMRASERLPDPEARVDMLGRKAVLDTLALALIGLRHGTIAPMLEKQASHNRAPLPSSVSIARGYAAAAMEIMILSGSAVEKAARTVAFHIKGHPELLGVKTVEWKAVQRWRNDIRGAQDRPSWNAPGPNFLAVVEIATFDAALGWHAQLLAEGKGAPEQQQQLAMLVLDLAFKSPPGKTGA